VRSLYIQLVQWAFRRFYREFAWTYDSVAAIVSWGRWHQWVLAALPLLRGDILELGCGTGNLQQAYTTLHTGRQEDKETGRQGSQDIGSSPVRVPHPSRMAAIDASWQMLRRTQRRVPRADLARAYAQALPFAAESFDTVVATFPSEYIMAHTTLHEIRRVLRPRGQLVIILGAQLRGPTWYRHIVAFAYRMLLMAPPATAEPSGSAPLLLAAIAQTGMVAHDRWQPVDDGWVYIVHAEG
jgi:ubiquinone/menaquinone biosynthesis C-methylase UbiE